MTQRGGQVDSKTITYGKPEIADYGNLRELTEGCQGVSGDIGGFEGSVSFETSKIHCNTEEN